MTIPHDPPRRGRGEKWAIGPRSSLLHTHFPLKSAGPENVGPSKFQEIAMSIKVGSTVKLNSGGPAMTVDHFFVTSPDTRPHKYAACRWFDPNFSEATGEFLVECLTECVDAAKSVKRRG